MSGNMKHSSEIRSSDSECTGGSPQQAMGSPEGNGCSTVTSAAQNDLSHHQEKKDNSSESESSNSHVTIQMESAVGNGDPAGSSAQAPQYCRQEERKRYHELYEVAKKGNWKAAEIILRSHRYMVTVDLTGRKETILHVATQANRVDFVRQLFKYLNENEIKQCLRWTDANNNTAFLFAIASGNMEIVDIMGQKDPELLTKTGYRQQLTPLHIAALQEKAEMARHLYEKTVHEFTYEYDDLKSLLFLCVNAGIYDLALKLLEENHRLAFETDHKRETVLHILSRKTLGLKKTHQHELVGYLWNNIFLELSDETEIMRKIRGPPQHVAFNAAKAGNFKFLELLTNTYPYLIWEVDERNRSVIHIAVLNRQADIFNFMRGIGSIKNIIARYRDNNDGSNLLHMAATLPSKDKLNLVFGAAFQMTLELLWFEAVKKIMPPSFIEMENLEGHTPHELFTKEHEKLVEEAQSWTKKTTNCCIVVSTLITTGVFTATFSIPGGIKDKTGSPNYLVDEKMWFVIFSIFDAIAMISSSTSLFIFFSILISRHAEYDFQYKSLPMKLIFGLVILLISIISMMISFSSAFIMYFNTKTPSHGPHHNSLKWVPIVISILAFIPIPIFVYLLWPLWSDIGKLNKFSRHLS